jgi:hypothetical protein
MKYDAIKLSCDLCARSRIVKRRFPGDFDNLRQVMSVIGIGGKWRKRENHHQYRATTGAVLNWWKSTGTIMFQGPTPADKDLEAAFLSVTTVIEEEATGWIQC